MKRYRLYALTWIVTALVSLPLLAQEAIESGTELTAEQTAEHADDQGSLLLNPDHGTALWTLVLFIGLIFVLGKFVWPKITAGLDARDEKIRGDLLAAEKANADAQAVLADYEQKIAAAHAEARQLIDTARADGEKLRQRLTTETEAEITRLKDRAADQIEQAKQAAVADIYNQTAQLAVQVASKILQREINDADTDQLVQQSLSELGNIRNN